ncbi:AraC family transcriptional regulator [Sphingomonas sp.]|uniref:AraC family transcriptional regulator n=1 Tax=Sphingomonas sp. TaxID=28214 RepID=UPI001B1A2D4B|nr:AraC family transcriptional regulator [Sphingomonas sp.]MBO9713963.1 helix-turn-helix transcriptional regulator [Sphingomonas sp.]
MREHGAYGRRLGSSFRIDDAPAIVTRLLRGTEIAVTEIRSDHPDHGVTDPLPVEDAYLVGVQLRDFGDQHYWENGRKYGVHHLRAREMLLYDLKRSPAVLIDKPFHSIQFYLPRAALDAIADESNARRIGELAYEPGKGWIDETVFNLGSSLRAALEAPERANRVFVDHVTLALAAHVAQAYGGLCPVARPPKGGLAPWQERRAKERIDANLDGQVSLRELAADCGLSLSHFSRAFRETTGVAPHKWLLRRRVDAAKTMMEDRRLSLAEIATACGFADQSHFTRVFSQAMGVSPGIWRRDMAPGRPIVGIWQ